VHSAAGTWTLARGALRLLAGVVLRRRPPDSRRGFGFWWLVGTVAIAGTVGLIVAVVLSPVAGIVAFLVVGVWALISRARSSHADQGDRSGAGAELPATAASR